MLPTLAPLVFSVMLRWQEAEAAAKLMRLLEPDSQILVQGLARSQLVISKTEFDAITRLSRTAGVARIVYLNSVGDPRWFQYPDAGKLCVLSDEVEEIPFRTVAPKRAFVSRTTVYARGPNGVLEIAVPFLSQGRLIGMIILETPLQRG